MGTINLSVAVWVGFLALFGIATDNGVIVCTYLQQIFREKKPASIDSIRSATVEAGARRVRTAMMTRPVASIRQVDDPFKPCPHRPYGPMLQPYGPMLQNPALLPNAPRIPEILVALSRSWHND